MSCRLVGLPAPEAIVALLALAGTETEAGGAAAAAEAEELALSALSPKFAHFAG
jgi:hypothetical protein